MAFCVFMSPKGPPIDFYCSLGRGGWGEGYPAGPNLNPRCTVLSIVLFYDTWTENQLLSQISVCVSVNCKHTVEGCPPPGVRSPKQWISCSTALSSLLLHISAISPYTSPLVSQLQPRSIPLTMTPGGEVNCSCALSWLSTHHIPLLLCQDRSPTSEMSQMVSDSEATHTPLAGLIHRHCTGQPEGPSSWGEWAGARGRRLHDSHLSAVRWSKGPAL